MVEVQKTVAQILASGCGPSSWEQSHRFDTSKVVVAHSVPIYFSRWLAPTNWPRDKQTSNLSDAIPADIVTSLSFISLGKGSLAHPLAHQAKGWAFHTFSLPQDSLIYQPRSGQKNQSLSNERAKELGSSPLSPQKFQDFFWIKLFYNMRIFSARPPPIHPKVNSQ